MRGRLPKPSSLKAAEGNPGKRPLDGDHKLAAAAIPEMPDHILRDDIAADEWQRAGAELLNLGVIAEVDRAMFSSYCTAWSRYVQAETKLAESGALLVQTPNGYPMQNPYIAISNKAMEQIKAFGEQFGMSAVARVRVARSSQPMLPGFEDEFDSFMNSANAA